MAPDATGPSAGHLTHPTPLELLAVAEAEFAALDEAFDAQGMLALRALAATDPEPGWEGAGEVAASLVDLLDRLIAGGVCDREALSVHLRAWRLLQTCAPPPDQRAALLAGLKSICDRYPKAQAAA